jgi:hypothetical protein
MAAEQRIPVPDPTGDILKILGPEILGSGTTNTNTSSQVNSGVNAQADNLIQQILGSVAPDKLQSLLQGIFLKAKTAFGPNIAQSIAAGNRTMSDTSLAQLQNEAQARATAEAAGAFLEAQNNANKLATSIVDTKINASRQTQEQKKTGISPGGKALIGVSAASTLKRLLPEGIGKNFWNPATSEGAGIAPEALGYTPEQLLNLSGPEELGFAGNFPTASAATDIIPTADALSTSEAASALDFTAAGPIGAAVGAEALDLQQLGPTGALESGLVLGGGVGGAVDIATGGKLGDILGGHANDQIASIDNVFGADSESDFTGFLNA